MDQNTEEIYNGLDEKGNPFSDITNPDGSKVRIYHSIHESLFLELIDNLSSFTITRFENQSNYTLTTSQHLNYIYSVSPALIEKYKDRFVKGVILQRPVETEDWPEKIT